MKPTNTSSEKKKEVQIVVVDDSELSRRTIVDALEANNYNVVGAAESSQKALDLLATTKANLFIIDVVMPNISGIELAKIVTQKRMDVGIIMISTLNTEHIIIESISNGAMDFLQKPFDKNDLLDSVSKLARLIESDSI